MNVCVFDLDHTLVSSPLDLAVMALDIRALLERACGPLPSREDRYRVGELIDRQQIQVIRLQPTPKSVLR